MGALKDFFTPALAGLDDIQNANIDPRVKLRLLRQWNSPYMSRSALKVLRSTIAKLPTYEGGKER